MVSAWASANGIVLGQIKTDEKSNKISAIPELIKALEIEGCIVTIDAMGCQKNIVETIIDKGAGYVLALNGKISIQSVWFNVNVRLAKVIIWIISNQSKIEP